MFAVLQVVEKRSRFLSKFLQKDSIFHEYKSIYGKRYVIIYYVSKQKDIDCKKIYDYSPRFASNILLPKGFNLSSDSFLKRYNSVNFYADVAFKTMLEMTRASQIPIYQRSIGFVDLKGAYAKYINHLVCNFTNVFVYTHNVRLYGQIKKEVMLKYGVPIVITSNYDLCDKTGLIFHPAPLNSSQKLFRSAIVFSSYNKYGLDNVVSNYQVELPEDIDKDCPKDIDAAEFMAALSEFCNLDELSSVCKTFLIGSREACFDETVAIFKNNVKKGAVDNYV